MTIRYLNPRELAFRGTVRRAIESARAGDWEDAVEANRRAIDLAPHDVESHNRLGKALAELGLVPEAIEAYGAAARLDPHNPIARRNVDRLGRVVASTPRRRLSRDDNGNGTAAHGRRAGTFLADRGRSTVTQLRNLAAPPVLATASPGDPVALQSDDGGVAVMTAHGQRLGDLEPRLGSRLARLMAGGNRYEAVVASSGDAAVSLLIREVYRSPALARYASFQGTSTNGDASDSDAPDAAALLDDAPRRVYALDDDEIEPFAGRAQAERLNALLSGPIEAAANDPLAV